MTPISGLHHVTAISGPPQQNLDFFSGTIRQRLVKTTVNFDAPDTYHLYYGNRQADPGTILTFFPFLDAGKGRVGPGMASAYAYAVPKGGFDAWMERLGDAAVDFDGPTERFGARVLTLRDPDGAPVELVETNRASDAGLDGFHSVTLWLRDLGPTARLLADAFGYRDGGSEINRGIERQRMVVPGNERGSVVDLIRSDNAVVARPGAGTIHHVAFRARDNAEQHHLQDRLAGLGHRTTPVIDRQYFNAIYFREPGGVLFEIATDGPGFTADEPLETLGQALKLPMQHEPLRDRLTRILPPLRRLE